MSNIKVEYLLDPYKQKIVIGSTVAYNYSGSVRIGTVLSLERKSFKKYPKFRIQIQERDEGFTSTITSPHNLVVILAENSSEPVR